MSGAVERVRAGPAGVLELICVGDELLDGRTRDRNAHWLGARLSRSGRLLDRVTLVGDAPQGIVAALAGAADRAAHVLISGGLGPTEDDRTRAAAAQWLGVPLREDAATLALLRERFAERGRPFGEANRRQAFFPEGAVVLPTEVGSAAGFRVRRGTCTLDFVPGVPREFRWFAEHHWLLLVVPQGERPFAARRWRFFGLGESQVGEALEPLVRPSGPEGTGAASIHYSARFPEVHVYARAHGPEAAAAVDRVDAFVRQHLGDYLIGPGEQSLAERLGEALDERRWRITTAESCTGGQVAQVITSVSGASTRFTEGAITYSDDTKVARLGVDSEVLRAHGAVSRETALAMARGAAGRAGAELALAVTGIAGPTGGSSAKPVGRVHLALATPDGVYHRRCDFPKWSREAIRTLSTWAVLTGALWYLEGRLPEEWDAPDQP